MYVFVRRNQMTSRNMRNLSVHNTDIFTRFFKWSRFKKYFYTVLWLGDIFFFVINRKKIFSTFFLFSFYIFKLIDVISAPALQRLTLMFGSHYEAPIIVGVTSKKCNARAVLKSSRLLEKKYTLLLYTYLYLT